MNAKRNKTGQSPMAWISLLIMAAAVPVTAKTPVNTVLATITGLNEPWGVVVSPDSSTVYIAENGNNNLAVIDAATLSVTQYGLTGLYATILAVSPDGGTLWVTDSVSSGNVIGFSTANFQDTAWFTGTSYPEGLAVSPNGEQLYVASQGDNKVYVYSTAGSGSFVTSIDVGNNPSDVVFSPNGKWAYVTNYNDSTVSVINVATAAVEGSPIPVDDGPFCITISPDGKTAYTTNLFSVSFIDTKTKEVTATVDLSSYLDGDTALFSALTPDGKYLYVPAENDTPPYIAPVLVIETANKKVVSQFTVGNSPIAIAFAPNGQRAYVTNAGGGTVSVVGITQ
jgi:YVTN family beta-propeller protein